jgi:ribonuclease R
LQLGEQCSLTERRADDATREVVSWLKCEYLRDRVGEVFPGVVSAVTNFGLFVELKDLYVEGLVHVTALPGDYYRYDQAQHRLVGERTRQVFRLGDELTVAVVNVNLDERKIDFELRQEKPQKPRVSAKTKLMAEMHEQEPSRRGGGNVPRKSPAKKAKVADKNPLDSRELRKAISLEAAQVKTDKTASKAGKKKAASAKSAAKKKAKSPASNKKAAGKKAKPSKKR